MAHFTPSKNLPHIVGDRLIRSSKDLADNAPEYFDPTDRLRFDQHPDKLCCSMQFPNGYYLAKARTKPEFTNYPDWACLLLDVALLERPGTLFSPCNAATARGAYLEPGGDALLACYAPASQPGNWSRGANHQNGAPTDVQAEALVPAPVELSHLEAIVVPSDAAATNEVGRLNQLGVSWAGITWLVAPIFFDRNMLSSRIRSGGPIDETVWSGGDT
ncbi:MAG: DUF4433 domain-containing protein [Actinomycetota bacterium]|nr:DUF4433 domain-containing protein [Actinomycetota bacterium]